MLQNAMLFAAKRKVKTWFLQNKCAPFYRQKASNNTQLYAFSEVKKKRIF